MLPLALRRDGQFEAIVLLRVTGWLVWLLMFVATRRQYV